MTFTVDEGRRLGNNLFHSFSDFSIPTGGAVIFNNATDATDLDAIINRVTGQNVLNINGLIRANGDADFFLLNPNGIVFNNDAVLDIGGSFLATTAEQLTFADGSVFSTDIAQPTLLTISVPRGLQFSPSSGSVKAVGEGFNLTQNADNGDGDFFENDKINRCLVRRLKICTDWQSDERRIQLDHTTVGQGQSPP